MAVQRVWVGAASEFHLSTCARQEKKAAVLASRNGCRPPRNIPSLAELALYNAIFELGMHGLRKSNTLEWRGRGSLACTRVFKSDMLRCDEIIGVSIVRGQLLLSMSRSGENFL